MTSTASDLPRLRRNVSDAELPQRGGHGYIFDLYEVFADILAAGPRTEHWALQTWTREGNPLWVNLNATGSTIMDPASYLHLTAHHLAMATVPGDLLETLDELDDLTELPPGWNGYDVSAPNLAAIRAAKPWVRTFYWEAVEEAGLWIAPHVTADETGEVMFEWSNGDKALTAYVSEEEVTLARDWGPDIETEMESAVDPQTELRREWWAWLVG